MVDSLQITRNELLLRPLWETRDELPCYHNDGSQPTDLAWGAVRHAWVQSQQGHHEADRRVQWGLKRGTKDG